MVGTGTHRASGGRAQAGGDLRHPGRRAAVRRPGFQPAGGPAGRAWCLAYSHLQHRLRGCGRGSRERIRLLGCGRPALRHRTSPLFHPQRSATGASGRGHRLHERTHGGAGCGGILPAGRTGQAGHLGRTERTGRGRGLRRLFLVSEDACEASGWAGCLLPLLPGSHPRRIRRGANARMGWRRSYSGIALRTAGMRRGCRIPECRAAHGRNHADHRRPGQAGR